MACNSCTQLNIFKKYPFGFNFLWFYLLVFYRKPRNGNLKVIIPHKPNFLSGYNWSNDKIFVTLLECTEKELM